MNAMEFQIEKNSPLSVIQQIQEQIKLSIAMRVLKRGVVLPPIREVADFKHLLKDSQYDRILVSPGARNKVPVELHQVRAFIYRRWIWILRLWKSPESARA
jgi:hypothetical protein